jgi:predicted ATP-grasp superfamily ATP-dependent carboligase
MRILVHELVTGGGLAGQPVPPALVREGRAMRDALVDDLMAMGGHRIMVSVDPRFPLHAPRDFSPAGRKTGRGGIDSGLEVVALDGAAGGFDRLVASVDAVWVIAPESHRWLERTARRVERGGKTLLGSGSRAIRRASDKASLPWRLRKAAPHPATGVIPADAARVEYQSVAAAIGYPVVVKPRWGAGCMGVGLANGPAELHLAVEEARHAGGRDGLVVQQYVTGVAASVSLLGDGSRTAVLAVNGQSVGRDQVRSSRFEVRSGDYGLPTAYRPLPTTARRLFYRGGVTPLDHPMAGRAIEAARRACDAFPGLRGFVGVDLVLTGTDAVVIEVNPRLTTAYLGIRSSLDENVAAMAIDACAGIMPAAPAARRRVRFGPWG